MTSWLSFYSNNLLLNTQGIRQPYKDPSLDSSPISELKEFLLCTLALTQCPSGGVSRILSDSFFLWTHSRVLSPVHSLHCLNAHLVEVQQSSDDFDFYLNSQHIFFFCAFLALAQCPPGRASQNPKKFYLQMCFPYTALPPKVFNNLTSLPLNRCFHLLCRPGTYLSESVEFRSAYMHWYS